jgi:mRNA-degrading endonuclease toxin of MazEF toxin-antitoxin module
MIQFGEIYRADFGQAGPHPIVVVSREELNRGRYALVVVCTSARFAVRSRLPNCVPFQAGDFGFTVDCVAQCENILSIDQAQLDLAAGPIGVLDAIALQRVIKAIGYVIKSDCKPL